MEALSTLWFILIAVLWTGYLILDGFDLGAAMMMKTFAKSEKEQRVLLNSFGPVWDGNQVWLLTAGGATFAAFPLWYASLFSALYVPLTLALLALILRAVSIEYRGKVNSQRWRDAWTWCLSLGSAVAAFCVGAMLALTTTGMPINDNGDNVGGAFAWVNIYAIVGGLAILGFAYLQGLLFTALKSHGEMRVRARAQAKKLLPLLLLFAAVWVLIVQFKFGNIAGAVIIAVAVLAAVVTWMSIGENTELRAFLFNGVFLAAGVASLFVNIYPRVLPSTIDDSLSLTVTSASSSDYTLGVMLVVTVIFLPIVLGYTVYSYRVFARRIHEKHPPPAHSVPVAIASYHA